MEHPIEEGKLLRSAAPQNAQEILAARGRAEELAGAVKQELEEKSRQLATALAMTRATLESTTDAILVTDGEGRATDFNTRFSVMWGIAAERISGVEGGRIHELMERLAKDPRAYRDCLDRIHRTSSNESVDVFDLTDGRVIEQFTRLQRVEGTSVGRVWSYRDITEHRRAQTEHAHLAAIVTSSTDAIISKTLEGIITSWNDAAERMFGYTGAEVIGQAISLIIPHDRIHEEHDFLRRLRRGERIENFTTIRVTKDGRHINVTLTISPIRDGSGQIIGASKIARDITEREQLLAGEQAARTRAEEASRLKDEFLATVSHELRTPLNAILGWAQLLRGESLGDERRRHAIDVIERNALTQAQVIEDILDVSRMITGKLRLNMQALMPVTAVESALESVRPSAEAKGVMLRTLLDPSAGPITGDPSRMQQIVWNLLSNSIKFTEPGGSVEVGLERTDTHVEIVVSDTGQGIAPEFLPHVFDRFRQGDASSARTSTGLGLGLAIVRSLVELHGGLVTAHSPGKGKGARFVVQLPLRPVHDGSADAKGIPSGREAGEMRDRAGAAQLQGVRVLVVDDERDSRELLRESLEGCGAEVRDAASASEAVELLLEWSPQVIVSDIGMPGEDGYTFIRRVRDLEKDGRERIPAVALTAYARSEDRIRALRAGYQVHVSKPVEPMELALVVAGVVQPPPSR